MSMRNRCRIVSALFAALLVFSCTACAGESDKGTEQTKSQPDAKEDIVKEIPIRHSYTSTEIGGPIDDFDGVAYYESIGDADEYTIISATVESFSQDGYSFNFYLHEYVNGKWEKTDLISNRKYTSFYQDVANEAIYGITEDTSSQQTIDKINEGSVEDEKKVGYIDALKSRNIIGIYNDQYAMLNDQENHVLVEYDLTNGNISRQWKDISIYSPCFEEGDLYALNEAEPAEVICIPEGKSEKESTLIPDIKKPMRLEVLGSQLFILAQDGIYQSSVNKVAEATKIFDLKQATVDKKNIIDFRVVGKEENPVLYLASHNTENGKYIINEIKSA